MLFSPDYNDLNEKIRNLERALPDDMSAPFAGINPNTQEEWKAFFAKSKEIQELFNSGIKFPTKEERQQAWERFNKTRSEGFKRKKFDNQFFENRSREIRNDIQYRCKYLKYSAFTDVLFFFDQTTKEQIKKKQSELKRAQAEFSKRKGQMTKAHKDELWELFQEIYESHQLFWAQHDKAWEQRKAEGKRKKEQYKDGIRANISKNEEKLRSAENALDRAKDRLRENRDKYYSADTDKWRNIFSEWVHESEEKIRDIEESIERLKGWIDEDYRKLND